MGIEFFIIGGALAIIVLAIVVIFNRLVQLRERCNDSWSQIDVQLKRRNDLIPNLVEAVKGYAKFEKGVFEKVALARSGFADAKTVEDISRANDNMEKAVKSVFAVAENYPELKANSNFLHLQDEISDAEERIAYSRHFYNDTVLNYNNSIQILPWNLIAGIAGMVQRQYFGAADVERKAVQVKME
ncbi:MAG TPA: LemA family protein [Candidatus Norongarragalinales archaeon]|nr:LemA family protein [Candidatus Norongarragalinales archaeon]